MFQSSSGTDTRCNRAALWTLFTRLWFQSSSGTDTRCNDDRHRYGQGHCLFQSSSGTDTRCNVTVGGKSNGIHWVSILIGYGYPMQWPRWREPASQRSCFNPHRVRIPDAIRNLGGRDQQGQWFQSSSGTDTRCNRGSITLWLTRRCFNPHRVRIPDAISETAPRSRTVVGFQSSSGTDTRCNNAPTSDRAASSVSILIGYGFPMQ